MTSRYYFFLFKGRDHLEDLSLNRR